MKLNLPNKLTLIRCVLVPVFLAVLIIPENTIFACIASALIFAVASFTDMLDGKIARKHNLITNFGKFMDPLADKLLVFGALLGILYRFANIRPVFVWCAFIVIFRELAVTSMRLVVSGASGKVIAAKMIGKIKTVIQIAAMIICLLEPVALELIKGYTVPVASYISMIAMALITLISGIDYIMDYWEFIDPSK
ncbi:MAG: CDP-diacylglycerol--glycerol-3-phosphate 3-phosphatidyltransferase [Oscillospiraceae bacterium]|nr:CDP-diacylglycerol--glycerol-3-phosphate 3-phosphatidyltransferase [Oscillospiraceae bacterium]